MRKIISLFGVLCACLVCVGQARADVKPGIYGDLTIGLAGGTVYGVLNAKGAPGSKQSACLLSFSGPLSGGNKLSVQAREPMWGDPFGGTLSVESDGGLTLSLSGGPSGCAWVSEKRHVLSHASTWGQLAVVSSAKAHFYNAPDPAAHRKAYLVHGDPVSVLSQRPGWLEVEFHHPKHGTSRGWLRTDDFASPTVPPPPVMGSVSAPKGYFLVASGDHIDRIDPDTAKATLYHQADGPIVALARASQDEISYSVDRGLGKRDHYTFKPGMAARKWPELPLGKSKDANTRDAVQERAGDVLIIDRRLAVPIIVNVSSDNSAEIPYGYEEGDSWSYDATIAFVFWDEKSGKLERTPERLPDLTHAHNGFVMTPPGCKPDGFTLDQDKDHNVLRTAPSGEVVVLLRDAFYSDEVSVAGSCYAPLVVVIGGEGGTSAWTTQASVVDLSGKALHESVFCSGSGRSPSSVTDASSATFDGRYLVHPNTCEAGPDRKPLMKDAGFVVRDTLSGATLTLPTPEQGLVYVPVL